VVTLVQALPQKELIAQGPSIKVNKMQIDQLMMDLEHFHAHYFHYIVYALVITLIFLMYKTNLLTHIYKALRKNKLFFVALTALALIVSLKCFPFKALVYYDEQNYLIQAQNIMEHSVNSLCITNDNGTCIIYSLAPHGIGLSSIYSLLYDYDYDTLYRKISIFNLFLYILNAFIIFVVADRIFMDRNVSRLASALVLLVPYNIIQATNVMPETMSNTFLLISAYALIGVYDRTRDLRSRKNLVLLLLVSLVLLSSLRVEYSIVLSLALVVLFFHLARNFRRWYKSFDWFDKITWMFMLLVMLVIYSYFILYARAKSSGGSKLGLGFANSTYVKYYLSSIWFVVLSICFASFLVYFLWEQFTTARKQDLNKVKAIVMALFLASIAFYSIYNYPYSYRFLIPLTSLYLLFSAAGLKLLLKNVSQKKIMVTLIFAALLVPLAVGFTRDAFTVKSSTVHSTYCMGRSIETIGDANRAIAAKGSSGNPYYYFVPSYLGQIDRIQSYSNNYDHSVNKLASGYDLYYVNSFFEDISKSAFNNPEKFTSTIVFNDSQCGYNVYCISMRNP
jgi:hypothetical protein